MKIFLLSFLFVIISANIFPQEDLLFDQDIIKSKQNFYDYSYKYRPFMEVKVWGAVKNPGVYRITEGTNLLELLSFSGGLTENAELSNLRIVRLKNDSLKITEDEIIPVDYEALFTKDDLNPAKINIPLLINNDIVVIPKAENWFEDIRPLVTILSLLSSIGTLVYVILRLN